MSAQVLFSRHNGVGLVTLNRPEKLNVPIKEAIQASLELPLAEGLRLETALLSVAFASEDKQEGVRAFL